MCEETGDDQTPAHEGVTRSRIVEVRRLIPHERGYLGESAEEVAREVVVHRCATCNQTFDDEDALREHLQTENNIVDLEPIVRTLNNLCPPETSCSLDECLLFSFHDWGCQLRLFVEESERGSPTTGYAWFHSYEHDQNIHTDTRPWGTIVRQCLDVCELFSDADDEAELTLRDVGYELETQADEYSDSSHVIPRREEL